MQSFICLIVITLCITLAGANHTVHAAKQVKGPVLLMKKKIQPLLMPDKTLNAYFLRTNDISVISSSDEGHSWSEPKRVLQAPDMPEEWEGLLALVDGDNIVYLFLFNRRGIWLTRSQDWGEKWEEAKQIYEGPIGPLTNEITDGRQRLPATGINNPVTSLSVIQLASHRLLLPFHYWADRGFWNGRRGEGPDSWTDMGNYIVSVLYSDDKGVKWTRSPEEIKISTPSIAKDGAESPVLLEMKDHRVWMVIANQRGRLFESWSKDGMDWTLPAPTSFLSSESPASLTRLKNGDIVMLWNNCLRHPLAHGGRHMLHASISKDDGATWRGFREVYRDPIRNYPLPREEEFGTGYPQATETATGKVIFGAGQGKSEGTLIFDPQWLFETHQEDHFMSGLKNWSLFGTKGVELASHTEMAGYYAQGAQVLRIFKADPEWPAAAVWNFPSGEKGKLNIRLKRHKDFGGTYIMLTDHFSCPFEPEDRLNAVFDLEISPNGYLGDRRFNLKEEQWYDLLLKWDFKENKCEVLVDGKSWTTLPQLRVSNGVSYIRFKSASTQKDGGIFLESVRVDIEN